ncbi:MAG: hypothetical protein ACI4TL_00840, partial [Candidatus Cryptobacteroides sp.]
SNTTLEARVNELSVFYGQMANNKKQIESMTKDIKEKLDEFPADVKEEDAIYLALRTWEEEILVGYEGITIGERDTFASIPAEVVNASGIEGLQNEINFIQREVSYSNIASYSVMKDLLDSINRNPEKITVSSVAYAAKEKDASDDEKETGTILEGTIDVTFYAVTGTGKEYVPREFEDFPVGIGNLFGGPDGQDDQE